MTFAPVLQPRPIRRSVGRTTSSLLVALIAMTAVTVLTVGGIAFVALAIAFPIAVPVALEHHLPVSPADAALAQRFAEFAWIFVALGIASFTAAAAIVIKAAAAISSNIEA